MYYPCSENKGADQLRGYREADLRLCFRLCRLLVFPWGGSFIYPNQHVFYIRPFCILHIFVHRIQYIENTGYVRNVTYSPYAFVQFKKASTRPSPKSGHIFVIKYLRNRPLIFTGYSQISDHNTVLAMRSTVDK